MTLVVPAVMTLVVPAVMTLVVPAVMTPVVPAILLHLKNLKSLQKKRSLQRSGKIGSPVKSNKAEHMVEETLLLLSLKTPVKAAQLEEAQHRL
jgi:hypothetical protein